MRSRRLQMAGTCTQGTRPCLASVLDPGFWILDSGAGLGSWTLDSGFWVLDLVLGSRTLDSGFWIPDSGIVYRGRSSGRPMSIGCEQDPARAGSFDFSVRSAS